MQITLKRMETDDEIRGKAFVHYQAWKEAYAGIVDQDYLDRRTLEQCEEMAAKTAENTIIAKDGERVIGFVQYGRYPYEDLENAGEIIALYVLADYFRMK